MKMIFTITILFLCLQNSSAQRKDPFVAVKNPAYFDGFLDLTGSANEYLGGQEEYLYWQALGTMYSFLGRYQKAIETYNKRYDKASLYHKDLSLEGKQCSQEELNKLYSQFNVTLINEAHHISQHRAFMYSQLDFLKDAGYKYLALEALSTEKYLDSTLVNRGYPVIQKTGVYISDPVYGMLIRKALELDFILVPYDSYGSEREKNQAKNILNAFDKEKGKLVVYAGYGHICEAPSDPFMGGMLKSKLGEDVLTLTQTLPLKFKPITNENDCCEFYLLPRSNECYDYTVIPNVKESENNLPWWFEWMNCSYQPLSRYYKSNLQIPSLVQLFNSGESENAVPVYQYLVEKEEDKDMVLPFFSKGKYRLVIKSKNQNEEKLISY